MQTHGCHKQFNNGQQHGIAAAVLLLKISLRFKHKALDHHHLFQFCKLVSHCRLPLDQGFAQCAVQLIGLSIQMI